MTPAVRALEEAGAWFAVHPYRHDASRPDFGMEAAEVLRADLGVEPDRVFKTIVVVADGREAVAVVPVTCRVGLRAVGAALGCKRVEICDPTRAERITGYVVGGISPFGRRRRSPVVIDETCELHETVFVSGGRRGLDVEVRPADLVALTGAVVADIAVA